MVRVPAKVKNIYLKVMGCFRAMESSGHLLCAIVGRLSANWMCSYLRLRQKARGEWEFVKTLLVATRVNSSTATIEPGQ
jgi:hypothetical protein